MRTTLCLVMLSFLLAGVLQAATLSESQVRSEAAAYDAAVRSIASIATMSLERMDDLNRANAIIDREQANLRFSGSKLLLIALSDPTFSAAVKQVASNKVAADDMAKKLKSDPKVILTLNGAQVVAKQMQQSLEADVVKLLRVAQRFQDAATKAGNTKQTVIDINQMLSHARNFVDIVFLIVGAAVISGLTSWGDSGLGDYVRYMFELQKCLEDARKVQQDCENPAVAPTIPIVARIAYCDANWGVVIASCERQAMCRLDSQCLSIR